MKRRIFAFCMAVCMLLGVQVTTVLASGLEWKEEAELPVDLDRPAVTAVGNKIYITGGRNNSGYSNALYIYDTVTGALTTGKPMSTGRFLHSMVEHNGKIYVFGGAYSSGNNTVVLNSMEIYDIETDQWSAGADMSIATADMAAVKYDGKIYAFGGIRNTLYNLTNAVQIYDIVTNTWSNGTNMSTILAGSTIQVHNDEFYLIGGRDNNSVSAPAISDVKIYKPQTDEWGSGSNLPDARMYSTSVLIGNEIYVIGGHSNAQVGPIFNKIEIYNIANDTWEDFVNLPSTRTGAGAVIVTDRLYVIAGYNEDGRYNNIISLAIDDILYVLLDPAEEVQLSLTYDLTDNLGYQWTSSNPSVATVDTMGNVTAIAEGTAYINCAKPDGTYSDYIPVKVLEGASEIRLSVYLTPGQSKRLWLRQDPATVTWSSMNNGLATVDNTGVVTGVAKGLTIIKGEVNGKTYYIYVRVNN